MLIVKDLIPKMSSNTSSVGTVTVSSSYNASGWQPYQAFDKDDTKAWLTGISNQWIEFNFKNPVIVNNYGFICPYTDGMYSNNCSPKDFKFECYDEYTSTWIELDNDSVTRDILKNNKGIMNFYFSNNNYYNRYRLFIINNQGNTIYTQLNEVMMNYTMEYSVLIEQQNQFYSINSEFYNTNTKMYNPLNNVDIKNSENSYLWNNAFENYINNITSIDNEVFKPLDKFNKFKLLIKKKLP